MRYFGWSLGLLPLLGMLYRFVQNGLGPNPVTDVIQLFGLWGMGFLLGSLSIRPLVQIARLRALQPWKKSLGVWAFMYAALHALLYAALDQGWDWEELAADFTKRVHIRFGILALLGLLPLAATSSVFAQRLLRKKWKTLHLLVFPVGIFVSLHFMLARKAGYERASWALILVLLLILLRAKFVAVRLQKLLPAAATKK